ncbi:fungal-specific transcription factor domain-containing protein [Xylaria sp. FL1042]|nr:fungal-specific transcription factor domain-containing protein [Xylaria sp. FL1042]
MAGDSEPQKKPPLSCTSCRARKLKCDKQNPCRNCERSGAECVFPARKRIQRPRKTKNAELLQRLNRLESIVGRVGLASLEEAAEAIVGAADDMQVAGPEPHLTGATDSRPHSERSEHAPRGVKGVRPPQDSTASRYMSGEFWSSLCNEVGGLKQALEQSTDSDDDEDDDVNDGSTPESTGGGGSSTSTPPGVLLGTFQTRSFPAVTHPSPDHIRHLAAVYFRNVDMHLKILHRPTTLKALTNFAHGPETASDLSHELTALFFAIYYAAVTSLTPVECSRALGRPRADLLTLFQAGIEQALVRADYLNNTSLETLQALTLYACCLRSHNGSRASWALLGLPIRLAQALNLHQDGDGTNSRFSPFEAELRRRLWWQLIVLDIRAAEDRGTNTIIARGSYDTRLPHNIDDVEFGPDTTTPLRSRPGPSDMTFSLFTAQSSGIFLWSEYAQQGLHSEDETLRRAKHLESQFVKDTDPNHAASYLASIAVRLIILKMWLVMRYPLHPRQGKPGLIGESKGPPAHIAIPNVSGASPSGIFTPSSTIITPTTTTTATTIGQRHATPGTAVASRQSTLRTAVSIMELSEFLETGPYSDRTRWWSETYVQWHPLAVALAELCTQTEGTVVEHAWRVIEFVFPRWSDRIADAKRGSLWRPIRKLYKKAKAARKAALSTGEGGGPAGHEQVTSQTQPQEQAQVQSIWGSAPDSQLSGLESTVDYMAIDPALTADSGSIRPRLITDMIISESSAHTLTSGSPMPYVKIGSVNTNTSLNKNQTPELPLSQNSRRDMDMNMGSTTFNFDDIIGDPGQSIAQAFLGWPDLNFNIPAAHSAGEHDTVPSQAPAPVMTGMGTGEGPMVTDPALLDPSTMNWTTWDEFVLDTYAADSTPKSRSLGSEGS